MNYCYNCGNKLDEKAYVCPKCGILVKKENVNVNNNVDIGSFWWGVLGFFIPIVGLVLYISWKDNKPKSAKKVGLGALIATIINVLIIIMSICFFVVCSASSGSYSSDYFDWYDDDIYYNFE